MQCAEASYKRQETRITKEFLQSVKFPYKKRFASKWPRSKSKEVLYRESHTCIEIVRNFFKFDLILFDFLFSTTTTKSKKKGINFSSALI